MRKRLTPLLLGALAIPSMAMAQTASPIDGLWLNPHNSVAVRTGPCGNKLCGWIVWANAEAKADAKDSGIANLIGTELLEDYHPDGPGAWAGTVFVPDMGRHFSSEIRELSPAQLKVSGCILGGLVCKSQVWTRIARLPQ